MEPGNPFYAMPVAKTRIDARQQSGSRSPKSDAAQCQAGTGSSSRPSATLRTLEEHGQGDSQSEHSTLEDRFMSAKAVIVTGLAFGCDGRRHDSHRHASSAKPETSALMSRVEDLEYQGYSPRMTVSLRLFARSRCLRVMGVLAWLMLVTTSLAAAPMGMQGQDGPSIHPATSASAERCHHGELANNSATGIQHQPDCCGSQAVPGCHCAAMCASAVPTTLTMIASVRLSAGYHMRPRIAAPSPNSAPPLRPPLI